MTKEVAWVWGLPLVRWTRERAVAEVGALVEAGRPSYFITANTHYAMLTHHMPRLRGLNERAAFLLADGSPLVLASRWLGNPLPERVAGADLIFDLSALAAAREYRLFLLGGRPGVAETAARRLRGAYSGLVIAGTACPEAEQLQGPDLAVLKDSIRAARPDLLIVALGQPKGEFWVEEHHEDLGVPVSVQVGATLDFVAGRVARAPQWLQKAHLEWAYRMALEPRRLGPRYARNGLFLARMVAGDLARHLGSRCAPSQAVHERPGG